MAAASIPTTAERDADELRAAALLTLKTKRKKPTQSPTQPAAANRADVEPLHDPAVIDLNYGDEPGPTTAQAPPSPARPATATPEAPAESAMDVDADTEATEREEGEISDNEVEASVQANGDARQGQAMNISSDQSGSLEPPPALTASLLLPPSSPTLARTSATASGSSERNLRPKLKIPPEELHEIKLHILDILGLGVPPEFLVDLGLQPETIAYAFHELNLRLPHNLNLKGQENTLYPPSMNERVKLSPPLAKPPPLHVSPLPTRRPSVSSSTPLTQRFPPLHAGLPPKPSTTVLLGEAPRTSTIAIPARSFAPALATPTQPVASTSKISPTVSSSSPATPARKDLEEMESQKKQELKARKAVLDSLRSKKTSTAGSGPAVVNPIPHSAMNSTSVSVNGSLSGDAASDPVADFLRSIPVSSDTVPPIIPHTPEPMDVDTSESRRSSSAQAQPAYSISVSPTTAIANQNGQSAYRGVKRSRPVAADFNDEAGYSSSSSVASSDNGIPRRKHRASKNNEKTVATPTTQGPPALRKYASFAGLHDFWEPTSHVIHVSDSEDDDHVSPQRTQTRQSPNSSVQESILPPDRPLSVVLERHQLQIQQMKERIAAAEQKKLQKLKQPGILPVTTTTSTATDDVKDENVTPTLAEADVDVVMSEPTSAAPADSDIPGLSSSLDQLPRLLQQAASALARAPSLRLSADPTSGPASSTVDERSISLSLSRSRSHTHTIPGSTSTPPVAQVREAAVAAGRATRQSQDPTGSSAPPNAGTDNEADDEDEELYGNTRASDSASRERDEFDTVPDGDDDMEQDHERFQDHEIEPDEAPTQAARNGSLAA